MNQESPSDLPFKDAFDLIDTLERTYPTVEFQVHLSRNRVQISLIKAGRCVDRMYWREYLEDSGQNAREILLREIERAIKQLELELRQ